MPIDYVRGIAPAIDGENYCVEHNSPSMLYNTKLRILFGKFQISGDYTSIMHHIGSVKAELSQIYLN